jgi:hypothetical protein
MRPILTLGPRITGDPITPILRFADGYVLSVHEWKPLFAE